LMMLLARECNITMRQLRQIQLMMQAAVSSVSGQGAECPGSTDYQILDIKKPDIRLDTNAEDHALQDETKTHEIISSMISIHNRLLLASLDGQISPAVFAKLSSLNYAFIPLRQTTVTAIIQRNSQEILHDSFLDLRLEDIYEFDRIACAVEATYPTKRIVVPTGSDSSSRATIAFLMGCHMMLSHGLGFEETYLAFRRLHSIMDPQSSNGPQITVKSCLRAFCRAKCFQWITFQDPSENSPDTQGSIQIDEYLHYARSCCSRALFTLACHLHASRHAPSGGPSPYIPPNLL
jgi:hypothetical protein